jgi:hypothetical protein
MPSWGIFELTRMRAEALKPPKPVYVRLRAPGLSLTGLRLDIPVHAKGLPVSRALSLWTCRRHYPGAAAGRTLRSGAVQTLSGRHVTIGEGRIVEMPEEDANCLIPCGWIKLAGGSSEEAG